MASFLSVNLLALFGVSLAALTGLTTNASASDTYCGKNPSTWASDVAPELDGFYAVKNGAGVLSMAGRTMALPAGNRSDAAIETAPNGSMKIMSSQIGGEFELSFYKGAPWQIATSASSPLADNEILTSSDLGVLINCDPNDLPRLQSKGRYRDPESGQDVDFTLYLFAVDPKTLYGVTVGRIQTPNGPGKAQRVLTLSR
ncbi:hypothetical protein JM93_03928 [Roseibium hamelinense]|uniref:Uncharacterized protein n=1 Tax=Roseibium hamelinense TaxID=150831 RepID=A0A562SIG6_9HYPH|nr:hypothetical protein [Roseibium hamelinense]MTI42488.1 hypothetical protein [Roseibium hamelinense]TWI80714.1 hypothetical protein JM93_03928 [Roseibium hamelinense]